jgi:hypothetical protein
MNENINENNNRPNINYYLSINFKNKNHLMIVEFETVVSELKQKIYNYFKIEQSKFDLYYKNIKLSSNDFRPIALLFQKEIQNNPLLFLVDKESEKHFPSNRPIYSIVIYSNLPFKTFNQILNKFFEYKNCPNDALIKNNFKGIYEIKFKKSILATEFKQYFDVNYNNKKKLKFDKIILPPINHKTIDNENENKNNYMKDNRSKSIVYKNKNNGLMPFHYINSNEKYYCDKIFDTKNWLYKKGFINNTGKYNINNNYYFIKNYVAATPSEPPLLHNFREVYKKQWINERGFYP